MNKMLFLLLLAAMNSFGQSPGGSGYTITAQLTGFPDGTKFMLTDVEKQSQIDSAVIKNNRLVLKGSFAVTPKILWLTARSSGEYCILLIGNEKVTVKGDKADMPFFVNISGSRFHDEYAVLTRQTRGPDRSRDSLMRLIMAVLYNEDSASKARVRQIALQVKDIDSTTLVIRKQFVEQHLNTHAGLRELFFLKSDYGRDGVEQLFSKVNDDLKKTMEGKKLATFLKVGPVLRKGDQFKDIAGIDQWNNPVTLSGIKNKYILLDFSTTYCGPCMLSVEEMKELAEQYKEQLNIITYNADESKEIWQKGVKRDNIPWPSIWDGSGTSGEPVLKYGVNGYPTFVLIGPDGKIVKKWSGYGKGSLKSELKEVFAKN